MNKANSKRTVDLVEMALFIAIISVLAATPLGYIPLGDINATTIHIPVILAGITMGWKKGGLLGFYFGLTSFLNASFFKPSILSFLFSPLYPGGDWHSLIICFIPRILIGITAYFVFKGVSKLFKNESLALAVSGVCASMVNTILVMGGAYVFFARTYAEAMDLPLSGVLAAVMLVIGRNGIPEAICAGVLTTGIGKALLVYKKRH